MASLPHLFISNGRPDGGIVVLWQQIRVRYITLRLARVIGHIRNLLLWCWRSPLIWLIAIVLSILLAEWLAVHFQAFNTKTWSWSQVGGILAFYALCGIFWWAWQARGRLIVEEFQDYTNEQTQSNRKDQPASTAKGLATLLVVKLAQLHNLYHEVDEQRAVRTEVELTMANASVPSIKTEDVSEFLKSAVSSQSQLSLGPIAIPVGAILGLFGMLVQGPRIIGSLHKEADSFILTAQTVGSRGSYSWRVDPSSTQATNQDTFSLDMMVTNLALQIFTDLELQGTALWKATLAFSEGLRIYRDCLHTDKDRTFNLQKAEQKLIEALAADKEFILAYYNLGVIYTELKQPEAAESTFLQAIQKNPQDWKGYFALAVNYYDMGSTSEGNDKRDAIDKCELAIRLFDRIIELKPGTADIAKACYRKGYAQRRLHQLTQTSAHLHHALESNNKAVVHSWKALCSAECKGQGRAGAEDRMFLQLKTLASDCLNNLAVAYRYQAIDLSEQTDDLSKQTDDLSKQTRADALRKAEALLLQALFLDPSNAGYHFELGKIYDTRKQYQQAIDEYHSAIRISSEQPDYWAYLAFVYAEQHLEEYAVDACEKALDCISRTSQDALNMIAKAYNILNKPEQGQRVAEMKQLLEDIAADRNKGEQGIQSLKEKRRTFKLNKQDWEYAQIALALGIIYLDSNPRFAEKYFRAAIQRFREKHPYEIKQKGLYAKLALSLLYQNKNVEALENAERASLENPLRAYEWNTLGIIYNNFKEYQLAIEKWQKALLWKPNDSNTYMYVGIAYLSFWQDCRDVTRRNRAFHEAINYFKQALGLYKSNEIDQKSRAYLLPWLYPSYVR